MILFRKSPKTAPPKSPTSPFNDATTLGSILLRMKKITHEQLHQAIGVQARTNEYMLGALLVEQGAVTQPDVAKALQIQHQLRTGASADAELSLLEAVMEEAVDASISLDAAIERRKHQLRMIGENTSAFLRPKMRSA